MCTSSLLRCVESFSSFILLVALNFQLFRLLLNNVATNNIPT